MKKILSNRMVILALFGVALVLGGYSFISLETAPDGIVPMGDRGAETAGWITLAGSVVSAAGAIFGILTNWLTYKREQLRLERDRFEFERERSR